MAKSENQKLKILYLLDILYSNTDLEKGITMSEILQKLERLGIRCERKSVYNDIFLLREDYGVDIELRKNGKTSEYYVGSREFELSELRLLVDAVSASKFITLKKSSQLIKKLESLTSENQARSLRSQVHVSGRIKTMNETIYISVDAINEAINKGRKISFKYFEWTPKGDKKLRRDGALYTVSPCMLCWEDENYYLVAAQDDVIKHYRVDKMQDISVLGEKRTVPEAFDPESYTSAVFGMYGGREETVTLHCHNSICGAVIDRFGKDIMMLPDADGFSITQKIRISPQFFAWLCGFGKNIRITHPESVISEFKKHIGEIAENY
ncbi:MAG: WYL domain-containing protein [Clostridia bacterium]|nr:WYL domain-containing protein [Clostridia bacterium]